MFVVDVNVLIAAFVLIAILLFLVYAFLMRTYVVPHLDQLAFKQLVLYSLYLSVATTAGLGYLVYLATA